MLEGAPRGQFVHLARRAHRCALTLPELERRTHAHAMCSYSPTRPTYTLATSQLLAVDRPNAARPHNDTASIDSQQRAVVLCGAWRRHRDTKAERRRARPRLRSRRAGRETAQRRSEACRASHAGGDRVHRARIVAPLQHGRFENLQSWALEAGLSA